MNFNNYSNQTEILLNKTQWLEKFGSTYTLDILYTYVLTPISFFGFLINLLSFYILLKPVFFAKPIFSFFRVYAINSALVCLLLSTYFLIPTYTLFAFTNTMEALTYGAYFYTPVYSTIYFFNSFLDVYINMERVSIFVPLFHRIYSFSSKKTCSFLFAACLAINFPYFFYYKPQENVVELDTKEMFVINAWALTDFAKSISGKVIAYVIYFIRDVLTLFLEIILNIFSVVLMKKHLDSKRNVVFILENVQNSNLSTNLSKADKNITYMVLVMSLLSALQHTSFLACTGYFIMKQDLLAYSICYGSNQIIAIKYSSNFFLFLLFNKLFRKTFKNLFKRNNLNERNQ